MEAYLLFICNLFNDTYSDRFKPYNSQPVVVVYKVLIQRTEQRQYRTGSCYSLQCQTAAGDCAVSGSVLGGVMWHSLCTQWLTAAGSPLNFLNPPPLLHTTYHDAVPSCDIHRANSGSLQQAHLSIFSTPHHCSTSPITVQYCHVTFIVHTVAHCSRLTSQFWQPPTTAPHYLSWCSTVMWHSSCTLWLTAAGSPLNFVNSPPLLHTTYHGAVPLNSHHLITSSADAVTSDRQFADTTCSMTSQQCWQFRLQ
jgi:hypothetical protein